MRLNEIICVMGNMAISIRIMQVYILAQRFTYESKKHLFPPCASEKHFFYMWAGNAKAWFIIEIAVFLAYVITMAVLMIKSRFFKVGID